MSSVAQSGDRRSLKDLIRSLPRHVRAATRESGPLVARARQVLFPPAPPIMDPYVRRRSGLVPTAVRLAGFGLVVAFCYLYGAAFAILGQWLILAMLFPLAALALLVIWALPASERVPIRLISALFMMAFVCQYIWPQYLGYRPPGLPWVTLGRVVIAPLALLFLIAVSTSRTIRAAIARTLSGDRMTSGFVIAYFILPPLSIVWAVHMMATAGAMIDFFLYIVLPFFAACVVFQRRGTVAFWVRLFWTSAVFVSVIAILELRKAHVLWAGHIPALLTIQDPAVQLSLMGAQRRWADGYRAQSTIGNPMAAAEYLALALPFVIHSMFKEPKLWARAAAAVSVPIILLAIYATHARSGMGGALTAILVYAFYWGIRKWRSDRASVLGPAVVATYPLMALAVVASVFVVGRVRRMVLGSGGTEASNQARVTQWRLGWPQILHRPWGHGWTSSADVVGFHEPGGLLTIDSWTLSTLVDLGFVGLVVFLAFSLRAIYKTGVTALTETGTDPDGHYAAPVAISLIAWLEIRNVLSEMGNLGVAFMLMAMGLALMARSRAVAAAPAAIRSSLAPRWRNVGALGMPAAVRRGS